ncbi:MAG: TonB-dependent receptor [Opitutaceae bacterium]|nr:TonB-dependent receptor [Opitutaceae bacterium]
MCHHATSAPLDVPASNGRSLPPTAPCLGARSFSVPQTAPSLLAGLARRLGSTLAALACLAAANSAVAGEVVGRVRDVNTNTYLASASVSIPDLDRRTTTLTNGEFALRNVPAGEHTVVVSYIGYDEVKQQVIVTDAGETRLNLDMGSEVLQLGKFVVSGTREGQAKALQQKRFSDSIVDIVSADSAGKLPDGNAAEAVRRLPGVYAQIDQNEGRFIVVRGIDPSLNNVTINDLAVGSPQGDSRGTSMDAVPADLISSIEVIKAVTPDRDAQAVGASVNITTASAFDQPEPFLRGMVSGGHFNGPKSEFGKNTPYAGSITGATQFGGGKWGILAGASYSFRHYISNRRSGGSEWFPAAASGAGANIYFPEAQDLYYYDVQRWRRGANVNLEFRPNDDHQFFLRTSLNYFKDDEGRDRNNFEFFRTAFPASFTDTTARFTGGRMSIEYRHYVQMQRIYNYSFGGKHKFDAGATQVDYTLSLGDTGTKVPARVDWRFRTAANLQSEIDISNPTWKVTPTEARFYDMAIYPMRDLNVRSDDMYEEIQQGSLNLKRERLFFGRNGFWQIGGKGFYHKKGWDRSNRNYIGNLFNLSQYPELTLPAHEHMGGYFTMTRRLNFAELDNFRAAHPNFFPLNLAVSESDSFANFFRIMEEQYAAYAMAKVDVTSKLSILAGVRMEDTKVKVTGVENATVLGVVQPPRLYKGDGQYTHYLPGLHAKYVVDKHLQFHFAYTNTIGRPPYNRIGIRRTFSYGVDPDVPGGNTYIGSVTDGNPDLKAYESRNFDLSAEYYFQQTGILSVGAFHKDIKNPIYTYQFNVRNGVFEGLNFSSLNYTKPLNAEKGRVTGIEFNYQQQFTKLPAPFDGLGFGANFTLVDSMERLPTRPGEKLPFASQSDKLYNIQLFYEKYRIEARVAYGFTGPFLTGFGDTVNADTYQAKRSIIDAKVSYRLNKHLSLFADVINLGEEPLDEYGGFPNRQAATEHYWWTANFGINWRL